MQIVANMSSKYIVQVLESLEESLSSSANYKKVTSVPINSFNYGLLIYSTDSCQISFLKLSFDESKYYTFTDKKLIVGENEEKSFDICLLNVFCLPFGVLEIICNKSNIWAIGRETVVDIKSFLELALRNYEREDYMDTDESQQFDPKLVQMTVNAHQSIKYDFYKEDIFISCSFIDHSFVLCRKNANRHVWQLQLVSQNDKSIESSSINCTPFLDIPISFDTTDLNTTAVPSIQDQIKILWTPIVLLIHHDDYRSQSLLNLFGIKCTFPNAICLIGHPDGKLLWSFWNYSEKLSSSLELKTLYNVKQPITGIYFLENAREFKDFEIMLVVGALGQITLFSPKKLPSFTPVSGNQLFWYLTMHLKSAITNAIALNDCLLYTSSDESLWNIDLSAFSNSNVKELHPNSNSSGICGVEQMIILNKSLGLLLLKTSLGNMYTAVCKREIASCTTSSSLPSLMNECLQQSIVMQELLHIKVLQSKFFAALSTFTSLKFGAARLEEPILFSISEINVQPKKYMLIVSLKSFEKLHLDSDLCYVSGSVFTYFQDNYTLVSKTVPYNPDHMTLCLELTDTVLQSPFISIFPLFVEIGLILQLPDHWKTIDCFKTVSDCLPIYLRIQTFMVHEFHLFQSNTLCMPQSFNYEKSRSLLEVISELRLKKPISNLMQIENQNFNFCTKFIVCISTAFIEERMKVTGDTDPCKCIQQLVLKKKQQSTEENLFTSPKCPISVSVTNNSKYMLITLSGNSFDSLVGLKIAVLEMLLISQNQKKIGSKPSTYVNIPASIYRRCEEISKSVMDLYGKDVESSEITNSIVQVYQELRRDISGKLPVL